MVPVTGAAVEMTVEKIGPDRARELLGLNVNRRVRQAHAIRLRRDMEAGNWRPYSVIRLARTEHGGEVLIDGQHRMLAVVASGLTFEFIVISGLDIQDQEVVDTGIIRSLSDALTLRGEANASRLGSAIGVYWRRQRKMYTENWAPTIAEGLAVLREHPRLRLSIQPVGMAAGRLKVSHGLAACLHYQMTDLDSEAAADFWGKLATGADLHDRHPIHLLRTRLERNAITSGPRLDRPMVHALIIKAWNAYMRGEDVGTLKWTRGGPTPESFPELIGPDE